MKRIIMCTGKGGVGKTTIAVATAFHFARSERVLLLSTDPSGSLSTIFNAEFHGGTIAVEPNLHAIELTRPMILKLWRERFGEEVYGVISSVFPVGREILDYLEGAPALDEEFLLYYVLESFRSGRYDRIVWDTAPTVSTLNLLRVQEMFYSHLGEAQKLYLTVKGVLAKFMQKPGAEPLKLIEKWREMTEEILTLLSRDTSSWIVAAPERLPVEQAFYIAGVLTSFGIGIKGFVCNRLLPDGLQSPDGFLAVKREQQKRWLARLMVDADAPVVVIEEQAREIITRDTFLEIADILYPR